MLLARHRTFQFSVFVTCLIATIQLSFDRVDLLLLIRERLASMMNEDRTAVPVLALRNLAIEIESALLQLFGGPFSERRIRRRIRTGAGCLWTDGLTSAGRALTVNRAGHERGDHNCQ